MIIFSNGYISSSKQSFIYYVLYKLILFTKLNFLKLFSKCILLYVYYNIYLEYNLLCQINSILTYKHYNEVNSLNGIFRRDGIFYVEKKSFYGIFDNKLGKNNKGAFIVSPVTGNLIAKKNLNYEKNKIHFILGGCFPYNPDYSCYYIELNLTEYMNEKVLSNYLTILKLLKTQYISSFNYKEIEYQKTKINSSLIIYEYNNKELFSLIETIYTDNNFIINDLKYQLNVLNKKHTSRLLFSTEAVNIILQYLVKLKVLKYNIDLKEYPDIVQLLMPFDFVFRSFGNNWNIIEKKTLGFDLRNIKKSNLSHLFNIDVVNMYINSGGIYVVNKIISNNKTYYES